VTTSIAGQLGQADIYAVNLGPGDPQYAHRDARDGGMRSEGAMVHLSPGLRASEPYPFEELDRRKAAALADGRRVVDFGVGDPREETPEFIRQALKDAIGPTSSYPRAAGLSELRAAIAADERQPVATDRLIA